MDRTTWTDGRLDERMAAIDSTHDRIFEELAAIREDMRTGFSDLRTEMRGLRADFHRLEDRMDRFQDRMDRFQDRMVQVGFGLLGVTIASIAAIFIALISGGG